MGSAWWDIGVGWLAGWIVMETDCAFEISNWSLSYWYYNQLVISTCMHTPPLPRYTFILSPSAQVCKNQSPEINKLIPSIPQLPPEVSSMKSPTVVDKVEPNTCEPHSRLCLSVSLALWQAGSQGFVRAGQQQWQEGTSHEHHERGIELHWWLRLQHLPRQPGYHRHYCHHHHLHIIYTGQFASKTVRNVESFIIIVNLSS